MLPQGASNGNEIDPRMIDAITRTMMGGYLWKYTRKAGREGLSSNRHLRYFWIHPYTRTLYWSKQDPVTAGKVPLKAKSVAIQAVRVMVDAKDPPPSTFYKSLVVVTPGREIVFTAQTGDKHDTWFNALSYILQGKAAVRPPQADEFAAEDVSEFNPRLLQSSTRTTRSRASLASYADRSIRTASPQRLSIPSLAARQSAAAQRARGVQDASSASSAAQRESLMSANQGSASGRLSSLSGMFRPSSTLRGSISSRKSRNSTMMSAVQPDVQLHHAGQEPIDHLHRPAEQHERHTHGMQDVRECCDG